MVINVEAGGRARAVRDFGGLERAEWIGEPVALIEQDRDTDDAADWMEQTDGQGERVEG